MTTLYSSVIKLHALHAGQLTHDPGQWANAAFYGILHQVDSQMAEMLHGLNGRKPFTVSSLNGLPRNVGPFVALRSGWECWLHITTLGDQIFQPFIRHFLQEGARPQIQLGPIQFTVAEALTTPGSHPWAGFSSDEALLSEAEMAERLTLEFASPTAFNLGSQAGSHASYALFPTPVLVFESLAYKWREFAQPAIDLDFITDAASDVRVSDYRLQSQTILWKGHVQKGFSGRCTYDLRHLTPEGRRWLNALADFALYAGVGGKTTQGMGQVRKMAGAVEA